MRGEELRQVIQIVLQGESDEEIKSYVSDLRSGLSETSKKINGSITFLVILIATHYLSVSGLSSDVKILGMDFPDEPVFQSAILLLASVTFLHVMSLSYLMKYQRESYDWIKVMQYEVMGGSRLHEFRLPSNALLAADLLRSNKYKLERSVGVISWVVLSSASFALPVVYLFRNSISSALSFAHPFQFVGYSLSLASFLCCVLCCFILYFQGHLK